MQSTYSSRNPIIVGFTFMLLLMLGMGILGINYMNDMKNRLDNIVHIHNVRTDAFNKLRTIARERSLLLYQMNLEKDFFFTDDTKIKMSGLAGEFLGVREELQKLARPDESRKTLEDIMPEVIHLYPAPAASHSII